MKHYYTECKNLIEIADNECFWESHGNNYYSIACGKRVIYEKEFNSYKNKVCKYCNKILINKGK